TALRAQPGKPSRALTRHYAGPRPTRPAPQRRRASTVGGLGARPPNIIRSAKVRALRGQASPARRGQDSNLRGLAPSLVGQGPVAPPRGPLLASSLCC